MSVIGKDGKHAYIAVRGDIWEKSHVLGEFSLEFPQFYSEDAIPGDDLEYIERDVIEAIHESELLGTSIGEADNDIGHLIFEGIQRSKTANTVMPKTIVIIVPQNILTDIDIRDIV